MRAKESSNTEISIGNEENNDFVALKDNLCYVLCIHFGNIHIS